MTCGTHGGRVNWPGNHGSAAWDDPAVGAGRPAERPQPCPSDPGRDGAGLPLVADGRWWAGPIGRWRGPRGAVGRVDAVPAPAAAHAVGPRDGPYMFGIGPIAPTSTYR